MFGTNEIAMIGTGLGAFVVGAFAAWRGMKSGKNANSLEAVIAEIPPDILTAIRIANDRDARMERNQSEMKAILEQVLRHTSILVDRTRR